MLEDESIYLLKSHINDAPFNFFQTTGAFIKLYD